MPLNSAAHQQYRPNKATKQRPIISTIVGGDSTASSLKFIIFYLFVVIYPNTVVFFCFFFGLETHKPNTKILKRKRLIMAKNLDGNDQQKLENAINELTDRKNGKRYSDHKNFDKKILAKNIFFSHCLFIVES